MVGGFGMSTQNIYWTNRWICLILNVNKQLIYLSFLLKEILRWRHQNILVSYQLPFVDYMIKVTRQKVDHRNFISKAFAGTHFNIFFMQLSWPWNYYTFFLSTYATWIFNLLHKFFIRTSLFVAIMKLLSHKYLLTA